MLNSCELQFVKSIDTKNPEQSIEIIANTIDPNNSEAIKKQLNKIYSAYSGHIDSLGIEALHSIFKVTTDSGREVLDNRFLIQVKRKVNEAIVSLIFDGKPLTSSNLTMKLKGLASIKARDMSLNEQWKFVTDRQSFINNNNVDRFSSYLLAFHMPLVINSWYNKLISFDPETERYEFNINTKIRTDWNTDAFEEQEAEINNVLDLMLNATQLRDYGAGYTDAPFIPNVYLTKGSFFYAISKFSEYLSNLPEDGDKHYSLFLNDPYYVFEYIQQNEIRNSELWVNVLKSFANTWLYRQNENGWTNTSFLENSKKSLSSTFNPFHVLITTINKYRPQSYVEIKMDKGGKFSKAILDVDSGMISSIIAKTSIKVDNLSAAAMQEKFGSVVTVINNKLIPVDGASLESKINFVQQLTESHTSIDSNSMVLGSAVDSFIQNVCNCKNSGKRIDSVEGKDFLSMKPVFLALTRNLPYVKGTAVNALGKQLPTIGISSVTHSIPTEVTRLVDKIKKNKEIYRKAGLVAPKTVCELSSLFNTSVWGMPQTIYRSTISYRDGELIKDPTELSIPESFKLSFISDFLQAGKNKMLIEAITPSDKKRIPFFEFDLNAIAVSIFDPEFGNIKMPISEFEDTYKAMLNQINDFYKQSLANTLNDINTVLGRSVSMFDVNSDLLKGAEDLNKYLLEQKISETDIQKKVKEFNTVHGTNKMIASVLDTKTTSINGVKVIQISDAAIATVKEMNKETYWNDMYIHFLDGVKKLFPGKTVGEGDKARENVNLSKEETGLKKDIVIDEEIEKVKRGKHLDSELFKYFVYTNFLSENILVNTVGLPLAHKAKGTTTFESINTKSHITMVKRMVAHTATMHACVKGVPSGLPDQINMMTWAAGSTPMFTYSTTSAGGKRVQDNLDIIDGAIVGTRCVDNMLKQSMADVKPKGNMLKLLIHDLHEEKSASSLVKCAELSVDNAYLRSFGNKDNTLVGGLDTTIFMQLTLQNASLQPNTLPKMIDSLVRPSKYYNGSVVTLRQITVTDSGLDLKWDGMEEVQTVENNLFALWQALGGAWSCDKYGEFNESSQDFITYLFNNCKDVNGIQYLKTGVIHYFPTDTTQKALQNPIVGDLQTAATDKSLQFTTRMDISRVGVQLDADHSSEDSHIREVSQLMSNLAEGNYTPEATSYIYNALSQLVTLMEEKIGVDFENMTEEDKKKIDGLFGDKILRIFDDPSLDVMGLANQLSAELLNYNKSVDGKFIIPYSDRQFLSKYHTTTGSYFNKFIARKWSGRGDVIVPSHNMAMIYEDFEGNTYLPSDNKLENGSEINIKEYLYQNVWGSKIDSFESVVVKNDEGEKETKITISLGDTTRVATIGDFTEEFRNNPSLVVGEHEVRPGDNYYKVSEDGSISLITHVAGLDQLYSISDDIAAGNAIYYRAVNLPRNLKSKQVGISVNGNYHDVFHSKTYRKIWLLDKYINDKNSISGNDKSFLGYDAVELNINIAVAEKTRLQQELERDILPLLKTGVVSDRLAYEFDLEVGVPFELVVKNDETIIANNNSKTQGDARGSEINQKKEQYFLERLATRFNLPAVENLDSYSGIFYTNDGTVVLTTHAVDNLPTNAVLTTPVVDEDGYRLDKHGDRLYKVPENAVFYKVGNYNVIVTDDQSASKFSNENSFAAYRWFRPQETEMNISKRLLGGTSDELIYRNIAAKQYKAWLEANKMISARIPSQSLSFAAALHTVAYTPWKSNSIMVPNSYVYIQGSDYDIDKIYSIMMGLNKLGTLPQVDDLKLEVSVDPVSTFNSDEQAFNTMLSKALIDAYAAGEMQVEDMVALKQLLSNIIYGYTDNNVTISNTLCRYNKAEIITLVSGSLENAGYVLGDAELAILNARFDRIISDLSTFVNTTLTEANSNAGIVATQNSILRKMLNVWNDPATLVAASTPTTMRPIKAAIEEKDGLGTATRYHHNPLSTVFINQTTAVGRKGISIAASGQKALLALNYYYSQFGEKSLFKPFEFAIPEDWQTYKTKKGSEKNLGEYFINFLYPGMALNEATIKDIISHITGGKEVIAGNTYTYKNCTLTAHNDFNGGVYFSLKINSGDSSTTIDLVSGTIISSDAAYKINSSLISSATDNAKEMDLDLINGSPEILPAYIFGLSVGMPMSLLVNIFTDPVITDLINAAKGDIFNGVKKSRVSKLLKNNKIVKDDSKRAVLVKLFEGADNLTSLASLLSINQGIEVYNGSTMEFQLDFEKTINDSKEKYLPAFNAEKFFTASPEDRAEIVKLYSKSKDFYNILDIFAVSNHFYQMGKVPFIMKRVVEHTSKDIKLLHRIMAQHSNQYIENQQKTANNVLRVLNHIKILEFLRQLNFEYIPKIIYDHKGNIQNTEENTLSISIQTLNGIASFKKHVEDVIYQTLKNDPELKGNQFIDNLMPDELNSSLFHNKMEYLASKVNLNDLQNIDKVNGIKLDFYSIADKVVDGHTVFEWFFLYDLIVHNHNIGGQSLTQLFDQNIDLQDENNLITQWTKFVNEYDRWEGPWKTDEANEISDYFKELSDREKQELAEEGNADVDMVNKYSTPGWTPKPSYLPLFVNVPSRFNSMRYLHRSQIAQIYANGNLLIYKC